MDQVMNFAAWWAVQSGGEKFVWLCVALAAVVLAAQFIDRLK